MNRVLYTFLGFLTLMVAGFAGGIWMLWKKGVDIAILVNDRQFIHSRIIIKIINNGNWFFFTAIYGSPNSTIRKKGVMV